MMQSEEPSSQMILENKEVAQQLISSLEQNLNVNFSPVFTLPGDEFTSKLANTSSSSSSVKIGHGLICVKDRILSTTCGEFAYRPPSTYWVKSSKKRYFPRVNDQVVGIIEDKTADFYLVNIFSGFNCILNRLAFEGATKRNKPELKKGDAIYARVQSTGNDADTELTCISTTGSKKEWSSGETVYGLLSQGLVVHVDSATARRLLRPDCVVLNALGRNFAYEIAVGVNGAVWFRSSNHPIEMIIIRNAILNSQYLDDEQSDSMVEKLVELAQAKR